MNYLSSSKAILFLFIALFSHFYNVKGQSEINCEDIFNKMFDATKNVKTLRANLLSVERFPDHVNYTRYTIKLNVTPYNLYTKDLDKGIEVLKDEGAHVSGRDLLGAREYSNGRAGRIDAAET